MHLIRINNIAINLDNIVFCSFAPQDEEEAPALIMSTNDLSGPAITLRGDEAQRVWTFICDNSLDITPKDKEPHQSKNAIQALRYLNEGYDNL